MHESCTDHQRGHKRDIQSSGENNYAVMMKGKRTSSECSASGPVLFSAKLAAGAKKRIRGVAGRKRYIDRLTSYRRVIQEDADPGHEALDVLHGLVYAPVALAIQALG